MSVYEEKLEYFKKVIDDIAKGLNYYNGPLPLDGTTSGDRLSKLRQIEAQNFVMYSLCCMGKKENCFFAVLQRYEPDTAYYGSTGTGGTGGNFQPQTETTP
jgi:hypothetical protein